MVPYDANCRDISFTTKIDAQSRLWRYSDAGSAKYVDSNFLRTVVRGFRAGEPALLKVNYFTSGKYAYHSYSGGQRWVIRTPRVAARPGEITRASVELLTRKKFVNDVPNFILETPSGLPWAPLSARITKVSLKHESLLLQVVQSPILEGVKSFSMEGITQDTLRFVNGRVDLQFQVSDTFGRGRKFALYYDGRGEPNLGIKAGRQFYKIHMIFFDGLRLKVIFRYRTSNFNIVTMYMTHPSRFYELGELSQRNLGFTLPSQSRTFTLGNVTPTRRLEKAIVMHGSKYELGRIGAEIAYAIAVERLGLKDIILEDPSRGGKDLHTEDCSVVIQSRILSRTRYEDMDSLKKDLQTELTRLLAKLGQDFHYNPQARKGYAMLTYVSQFGRLWTILVEIAIPSLTLA